MFYADGRGAQHIPQESEHCVERDQGPSHETQSRECRMADPQGDESDENRKSHDEERGTPRYFLVDRRNSGQQIQTQQHLKPYAGKSERPGNRRTNQSEEQRIEQEGVAMAKIRLPPS